MDLIPDTLPAVEDDGDGYEPDTEKEMVLENEDVEDNLEAPKKKKKGDKPKVRDLIKVAQEEMEVSDIAFKKDEPHASCCLIRFVKFKLGLTRA